MNHSILIPSLRNTKIQVIHFCCLFLIVSALSAKNTKANTPIIKLSLKEAIALATQNNSEMKSGQEAIAAAKEEDLSSWGKFLPQMNVEGKYTRLNAPLVFDLSDLRTAMISSSAAATQVATTYAGQPANATAAADKTTTTLNSALPEFTDEIQKDHYYNASITLTQPLFTGGKLIANRRSKSAALDAATEQTKNSEERTITDVINRYFSLLLQKQAIVIRTEILTGLRSHQLRAQKLVEQGQISKANKMRTDVAVAEAERELDKSKRDYELTVILLNHLLGTQLSDFDLSTPLSLAQAKNDVSEYAKASSEKNSTIKLLEARNHQLDQKITAQTSNFLPTVALFAKYELYRKDLTLLEPNWAAGIVARFNLFNGGSDFTDLRAARHERASLEFYTDHVRTLINTETNKYYHDLMSAQAQHKSLESSLALAEENLRLNQLSFNEGTGTALDVIDAQLALGKTKLEQTKTLYDSDLALANLLRVSGQLNSINDYIR